MTKLRFLLLFMLIKISSYGQYQSNYWFYGNRIESDSTRPGAFQALINTNGNFATSASPSFLNFESTMASISDSSGNLLLYTNGCSIANGNHEIIDNGTGLNPGAMADAVCENRGYIAETGAVFLPDPKGNGFWLIHMAIREDKKFKTMLGPLYASHIIEEDGKYTVDFKNFDLLSGDLERFAIVKAGNGRDWWIITPKFNTNEYHKRYLGIAGFEFFPTQKIGPVLNPQYCKNGRGMNIFSTKGEFYVKHNSSCGPIVYNFDRCSGKLSNPKQFPIEEKTFGGGGVAFNLDDTRMYYSTGRKIFKLKNENGVFTPLDTIILSYLDVSDFGEMVNLQNRIYIRNITSGTWLHRISFIPFGGKEEFFTPNTVNLKTRNTRSMPCPINYQLAKIPGSPCDSLVNTTDLLVSKTFNLYPNPIHNEQCIIELNSGLSHAQDYEVMITNIYGMQVYKSSIPAYSYIHRMNLADLPSGVYFCNIIQNGQVLATQKLVVQ